MNKTEYIDAVAKAAKVSKAAAAAVVAAEIAVVTKALKKGETVQLTGYITISQGKRAARTGRNPQTGKAIKIAARKVVKIKAGKALKDAVK